MMRFERERKKKENQEKNNGIKPINMIKMSFHANTKPASIIKCKVKKLAPTWQNGN